MVNDLGRPGAPKSLTTNGLWPVCSVREIDKQDNNADRGEGYTAEKHY